MVNWDKVYREAERAHKTAKDGKVTIDGDRYTLRFKRDEGLYEVLNTQEVEVRFNTRNLAVAKRWLREWLAN